jgi:hypothetical protein
MSDLRPSISDALEVFGLDAVVTVPGGSPVPTQAMWQASRTGDYPTTGADLRRAEYRRVLVLPKAEVPEAPRGTAVTVPEQEDGDPKDWVVDSIDRDEFDAWRVVVLPAA